MILTGQLPLSAGEADLSANLEVVDVDLVSDTRLYKTLRLTKLNSSPVLAFSMCPLVFLFALSILAKLKRASLCDRKFE